MKPTVKQYLESLKEDVSELDIFCDDELTSVMCNYIINECIDVLEDVYSSAGANNYFVENKLDFLKEAARELQEYNIKNGYNPLEYKQNK